MADALVSAPRGDATYAQSVFPIGWEHAVRSVKGGTAMIRIWSTHEASATTITVDGRLVGDYVDSVQACVDQAMSEQKRLHLFLRDVSHIDEAGRALLVRLAAKGVVLSASGLYSSYVVAEITRQSEKKL
jgi:hypothetical protein